MVMRDQGAPDRIADESCNRNDSKLDPHTNANLSDIRDLSDDGRDQRDKSPRSKTVKGSEDNQRSVGLGGDPQSEYNNT